MKKTLARKGGKIIKDAEDFLVNGREGPVIDGELDRTKDWARGILSSTKTDLSSVPIKLPDNQTVFHSFV